MKVAAAYALASLVSDEELNADYILPAAFDPRVKDTVAKAVCRSSKKERRSTHLIETAAFMIRFIFSCAVYKKVYNNCS